MTDIYSHQTLIMSLHHLAKLLLQTSLTFCKSLTVFLAKRTWYSLIVDRGAKINSADWRDVQPTKRLLSVFSFFLSRVDRPCAVIYPAAPPITTVSLAANTYCMMDGLSACAPRTVGPRVQFSSACVQNHCRPANAYSRRPSVISGSSSD